MEKKKLVKKQPVEQETKPQDSEETEEFEVLEDDEGSDDDVEFEEEEEEPSKKDQAPSKQPADTPTQADPKNPLGLKRDDAKPIPVRRPASAEGKIIKGSANDNVRQEQIRKDRLESAKRYESLRLYDEALKYYKLACDETEIARIQKVMNDLYVVKAKEFEAQGRFEEAANLYDILKMKDDAQACKSKGGTSIPPLDLEDANTPAISAFRAPNNPALLANPQKSPYIAAGQEEVAKESAPLPLKKPKDAMKAFSVCPYCGEDINLPKPPKFCPYCREPFQ